jgi:iron complex outermembrane receptor protein
MKTDINVYGKWQQKIITKTGSLCRPAFRTVEYNIYGFRDNPSLTVKNNYNFLNPKAGIRYSQ